MSTAPAAALERAIVTRAWDETPAMRRIVLDAEALARRHTAPGQYVEIARAGQRGLFALASPPGTPLELLARRGAGGAADALGTIVVGDLVEVGPPTGPGFPVDAHAGQELVLLGVGSGIAPLRAVIEHVLADRARWGRVRLYYGQKAPSELAYLGDVDRWRAGGVEVVHVLSEPAPGWTGPVGYVQDVLAAAPPPRRDAVVYLCGMQAMIDGATAVLARLGVGVDRVFVNF